MASSCAIKSAPAVAVHPPHCLTVSSVSGHRSTIICNAVSSAPAALPPCASICLVFVRIAAADFIAPTACPRSDLSCSRRRASASWSNRSALEGFLYRRHSWGPPRAAPQVVTDYPPPDVPPHPCAGTLVEAEVDAAIDTGIVDVLRDSSNEPVLEDDTRDGRMSEDDALLVLAEGCFRLRAGLHSWRLRGPSRSLESTARR